jgi:hypothetical protein
MAVLPIPSRLRTCLCLRPSDLSLRLCARRVERPLGRGAARRVERLLALESLSLEAPLLGRVARA